MVGVGRDVRPEMRRNWLVHQEDEVLRLVLVLLPIVMKNTTRGDTRGDRKRKKRRELLIQRADI